MNPSEWLLEQFDKLPYYRVEDEALGIIVHKVDPPRSRSTSARRSMFNLYNDNEGLPCLTSTSSIGLYEEVPEPELDLRKRYDYDGDKYVYWTFYGGKLYEYSVTRLVHSRLSKDRLEALATEDLLRKIRANGQV